MIPIIIVTEYTGLSAELIKGHGVRAYREASKGAHEEIGRLWHRSMLPEHFKASARSKYGHAPRSAAYKKRKLRRGRGRIDLVFTGLFRDSATRFATIKGYPTRVSIGLQVPTYARTNYRKRVNPEREVLAVTADERQRLLKRYEASLHRRLKAIKTRVRRKTK